MEGKRRASHVSFLLWHHRWYQYILPALASTISNRHGSWILVERTAAKDQHARYHRLHVLIASTADTVLKYNAASVRLAYVNMLI